MRKSTCAFCGVEQQIQDKQLAVFQSCAVHIKCYQCGEFSSYPKNSHPADLDLKKLFVFEKKDKKIPSFPKVQLITSKRKLMTFTLAVLIALNVFFVTKLNLQTIIQPETQKLYLTSAAPLPTAVDKKIELKIVNQFEASVLVPKAIVRSGPGIENQAIYSLQQNERILVKGWSKNWMNIEVNIDNQKITGWVRADLITGSF